MHKTWGKVDYIATVSEDLSKTKIDYRWLLKTEDNIFYNVLMKVNNKVYKDSYRLFTGLDYWFEKVRGDAGVSQKDSKGGFLNMRSVRCHHATKWVMFRADMLFMKWNTAIPPNPLQHMKESMTIKTYAAKGADDREAAKNRCLVRYKKEAAEILRKEGFHKLRNRAGDKRAAKHRQVKCP